MAERRYFRGKSSSHTLYRDSEHLVSRQKHETEPRLGNNDDYPQLNDRDLRLRTLLHFRQTILPRVPSSRVHWKFLPVSFPYFHPVSDSAHSRSRTKAEFFLFQLRLWNHASASFVPANFNLPSFPLWFSFLLIQSLQNVSGFNFAISWWFKRW